MNKKIHRSFLLPTMKKNIDINFLMFNAITTIAISFYFIQSSNMKPEQAFIFPKKLISHTRIDLVDIK